MSRPSPLPLDMDQWPRDPYELLGVPPRAAPDEVRSAHDRLAAAFDPARAPEPCRRLREARDAVLRDLDLLFLLDTALTLGLQAAEPAPPRRAAPPDDLDLSEALRTAVPADAIAPQPLPPPRRTVIGLWQMALSGQEAEAYRGLVSLLEQDGPAEDVCLRLYWLLTAMPQLDEEHTPCHWLRRGLYSGGLGGPLWELYCRALAHNAEEALSSPCAGLFKVNPREPYRLVELSRFRWLAAARAERWEVITADLQVLHQRLEAEERVAWALVWSAALDQLVWSDARAARDLAAHCFGSLRAAQSVAPQVGELQQRANRLRDLAAGWRALRPEPEVAPPLLALIPPSWSHPFPEVRPQLLAFLAEALRAPRSLLRALDATRQQPAVLAQFGGLLRQLEQTLPPAPLEARSSSDLADLVSAFLDTTERPSHRAFRPLLLDFCLREAIAPETAAELALENPYYRHAPEWNVSDALAGDEPLRLTYLAHRLFWM